MDKKDINNSSYAYSVSLLKMLLAMQLITEDEYERITQISAEHYAADLTADAHGRQAAKRKSCGDASTALNTPRNTVITRPP